MGCIAVIAIAAIACLGAPAFAQDIGNATRGWKLAIRTCSGCHWVSHEGKSGRMRAPTLRTIANTKGMSAMALSGRWSNASRPCCSNCLRLPVFMGSFENEGIRKVPTGIAAPLLSVRNLSPLKAEDIVDELVGIRFRDDQVRHSLVV